MKAEIAENLYKEDQGMLEFANKVEAHVISECKDRLAAEHAKMKADGEGFRRTKFCGSCEPSEETMPKKAQSPRAKNPPPDHKVCIDEVWAPDLHTVKTAQGTQLHACVPNKGGCVKPFKITEPIHVPMATLPKKVEDIVCRNCGIAKDKAKSDYCSDDVPSYGKEFAGDKFDAHVWKSNDL